MPINTSFNFYTDANGGDPDMTSPTLRSYHQLLWSKPLPSGAKFDLSQKAVMSFVRLRKRRIAYFATGLGKD